jgi:hypothetical protein
VQDNDSFPAELDATQRELGELYLYGQKLKSPIDELKLACTNRYISELESGNSNKRPRLQHVKGTGIEVLTNGPRTSLVERDQQFAAGEDDITDDDNLSMALSDNSRTLAGTHLDHVSIGGGLSGGFRRSTICPPTTPTSRLRIAAANHNSILVHVHSISTSII